MRTRNSYFPNNSSVTILRRRNKRRTPNIVEPELRTIIQVAPMADNRTMDELLQAPTEGYGEAIVIPEINADHFEIKTNLLQLVQANPYHGFERDNPHTHINNIKRITSTLKFRDVPNVVIKLMMFLYSLEGSARVWENASKTDDRIDKLTDRISTLVDIFAKKVVTPALIKAIEESCVTCGGAHAYYNCPNTDSNQPSVCVATEPDVPKTLPKPSIPYPSRLNDQKLREKATNQMEKFFQIFQDLHFNISFADALLLMPKFASTILSLLTNKDKEEYAQKTIGFSKNYLGGNPTSTSDPILSDSSPSLTPFEGNLKQGEIAKEKSSIEEPPELELKDLPCHLEYAYLEGVDKLPVIIAKDLKVDEKEALLKVLLLQEFDIIIRDKKGTENLAVDHLSRLENPHKDVFENKDINENFPLETLGPFTITKVFPYGTVELSQPDGPNIKTQLLIAQKEEAGIQLQAEEYDLMAAAADLDEIEEVNANCILMANLHQASSSGTQTDSAPVYDSDGSAEVHESYDNNEIFNMFTQEEQYTELLEAIPEPQHVPQNDNNVISEVTDVEQDGEIVEQHPANFEETRVKPT
nr:reverse transcriptase domain-containing protein [Tanacetum cinerariifolium]